MLVVDDSAFMRKVISQMITSDPAFELLGTARDGREGLEKAKELRPDIVTLDVEMPVMDGLEALRRIRAECAEPKPHVVMCSSLTRQGSHAALQALSLGAADFVAKDASIQITGLDELKAELLGKLRALGKSRAVPPRVAAPVPRARQTDLRISPQSVDLLVIGSSTGGPPVLERLVSGFPRDMAVPCVVAQHMPPLFTESMSERLNKMGAVAVEHGEADRPMHPGRVYIIKGGQHGRVERRSGVMMLRIGPEPARALYKPSVDELFSSAAQACGARALGVILTGMGEDGKIGARQLRSAGGQVIAQDAASCVVYGMPRAVAESGIANASLSPEEISRALRGLSRAGGAANAA